MNNEMLKTFAILYFGLMTICAVGIAAGLVKAVSCLFGN
jgi:tetrahydromethanopterin S-methyltransferase subunit F